MSSIKKKAALAAMALGMCFASTWAGAAELPAAIKSRGKVIIAIDVSHPPYGMLDAQAKETGSDVETARLLAEDMGIPAEIVPVSGANRVPFLLSNKVDMVIASFSITADRKKVIAYSKPYGVVPVVVAATKGEAVTKAADLAGKKIAVARGTTSDLELTRLVKESGLNASIVRYEDESTTNTAVATGQQNIIVGAPSTIQAIAEQSPNLGLEIKFTIAAYPMAVGLRKNDAELKAWVDSWVEANLKNGKLNTIYKKYFHLDLPEKIPEE